MLPSQHYSDGEDETDQIAEERWEDGLSESISSDDEAVQLELHARIKLKGECRTVKRLMSLEFSSTTILAWFKLSHSFFFASTSQSADHLFPRFASRMALLAFFIERERNFSQSGWFPSTSCCDRESNSWQSSCTSQRNHNSAHFTDRATAAASATVSWCIKWLEHDVYSFCFE